MAALQGRAAAEVLDWEEHPLAAALPAVGTRTTFTRARREAGGLVPVRNQDSGAQAALAAADWLVRCDPGNQPLAAGSLLPALRW